MSSPELPADAPEISSSRTAIGKTNNLVEQFSPGAIAQVQERSSDNATSLKTGHDRSWKETYAVASSSDGAKYPRVGAPGSVGRDHKDDAPGFGYKPRLLSGSPGPAVTRPDSTEIRETGGEGAPQTCGNERLIDSLYLDPTPRTPRQEISPPRTPLATAEAQGDEGSTSEIQSIMDQFDEGNAISGDEGPDYRNTVTERSEHSPRRSSLEPLRSAEPLSAAETAANSARLGFHLDPAGQVHERLATDLGEGAPSKRTSSLPQSAWLQAGDANSPPSPNKSKSLSKLSPPEPDPEPDLPFDFHRFLEQLRHRTADPVAKFLRSFLIEFGKKQWMVHEQVKIINDFLTFITSKMAQCEVWRGVSDAEFDNAKEGMEKLVMNRLYSQTFSPAIPLPALVHGPKGKKKVMERSVGPGRKGQHQEDIERDEILGQKVRIYGWVQEEHLDIPPVGESGRRFLILAQQGKLPSGIVQ